MIPVIFSNLRLCGVPAGDANALADATREGSTEGAAAIGFAGAIGAYGGFFIPKSYGSSILMTGGPELALYCFVVFYLLCIGLTWWFYARRNAGMPC
jgi:NNP family nitrate/nitrite transporter-like MFS transporter